jgi:hypothetical protein
MDVIAIVQEPSTTLNRIGIVMNVVAGFLLAPEIIGLERIQRLELGAERAAKRIEERPIEPPLLGITLYSRTAETSEIQYETPKSLVPYFSLIAPLFLIVALTAAAEIVNRVPWPDYVRLMLVLIIIIISHVVPLLGAVLFVIPAIFFLNNERVVNLTGSVPSIAAKWFKAAFVVALLGFQACLGLVVWPGTFPSMVEYIGLRFVIWISRGVLGILGSPDGAGPGEERLRGYVVAAGVILFVVGNGFQLVATF